MFTGIIKKNSTIEKVSRQKGSFFVWLKKPNDWKIEKGESISINGICSTVKNISKTSFEVEYMPETLNKTTAGNFKSGTKVNIERSLRVGDLLGGHFVQGHIDGVGKVYKVYKVHPVKSARKTSGGTLPKAELFNRVKSKVLKVNVPAGLMKFIANKGSIAIDGVSLTIVDTGKDWFSVSLISYTLENTNLGDMKAGDKINIETDMLAKYLGKLR